MSLRLISVAFACAVTMAAQESAQDVVKRSLARANQNWQRSKDYTYRSRSVIRELDGGGKIKSTRSESHDVIVLYGRPYTRLVEKDDHPLKPDDEAKQEERLRKEMEKRRKDSEDPQSKERRQHDKERVDERKFLNEIAEAYTFRFVGEESISGKPAWIIAAQPKPGFQAHDSRAKMFAKILGKVWIDKAEYQWVKVEAQTTDTISFGWFLARLSSGSSFRFETQRINDEVWLPSHAEISVDGRLALVKKLRAGVDITYTNYRKFQTDSKVIPTELVK